MIEFRGAEGKLERMPKLAAELVQLKVDILVPLLRQRSSAAKQATKNIAIVMVDSAGSSRDRASR